MFRCIKLVFFGLLLSLAFISCEKEISEENGGVLGTPGTQGGTATYTLDGSVIPCSAPVISGTYLVGTALDITNTVVIDVDVTTIGTYAISTAVINGMSFTGAGTFATTGAQAVTLFGSGAPEAATSTIFIPGTSGCSFIITSTGTVNPGGDFLICKIDGVAKTFNVSAAAIKYTDTLSIGGLVSASSFETLEMQLIGTNTPAVGIYEAEGVVPGATAFVEAGYLGPALEIFYIDINAPTPRPNPFKVVITSITATRITGTFQGGMFDAAGGTTEKLFTEGSFDLPVQ